MAERIRAMSGCISCRIYQDAQENRSLMFEEIWKNEEDLNRHIRSDEYRNVLLVVEMAVEKPEIRFETVSHVTGMETIERARTAACCPRKPLSKRRRYTCGRQSSGWWSSA